MANYLIYAFISVVVAWIAVCVYCTAYPSSSGFKSKLPYSQDHMISAILTGVFWPIGMFIVLFFSLLLLSNRVIHLIKKNRNEKS